MGNTKRRRKQYITPLHPWQKTRIDEEKVLIREYGLKNKKEIYIQSTIIKKFIANFKKPTLTKQAQLEREQLIKKLQQLGIIQESYTSDQILGLQVRDVLERRLQTVVFKKGLARSVKQARQFITHRHIMIGDKVITSPAYLVTLEEQNNITFVIKSPLVSETHPERITKEQKEVEKIKKQTQDLKERQEEVVEEKTEEQVSA